MAKMKFITPKSKQSPGGWWLGGLELLTAQRSEAVNTCAPVDAMGLG
jgi:hypothetical protein